MKKLFLLGCLMFSLPLWADDQQAQQRLQQAMQQLDSFQANFEQTVVNENKRVIQQSTGQLGVERPGKFYWHYVTPFEQQLLSDGKNLWVYDVDLQQATVRPVDEALSSAPIMILMQQQENLNQAFRISEIGQRKFLYWIELEPAAQDMEFDRIYVGLEDGKIKAMELRDRFQQSTQIVFSALRTGVIQNPAKFRFERPAGVDLIGQAAE